MYRLITQVAAAVWGSLFQKESEDKETELHNL